MVACVTKAACPVAGVRPWHEEDGRMADVEMFLRDYWHARRSVGRLMHDLKEAQAAYKLGASNLPTSSGGRVGAGGKRYSGTSPVERAALLLVDQLGAEVRSIEQRLMEERRTMAHIETVVEAARLSVKELDFVRLRYMENHSVQATAQRLFCSPATCWRLKNAALDKISKVLDKKPERKRQTQAR